MTYRTRTATPDDMPAMLAIAKAFTEESALPHGFDRGAANAALWRYLHAAATDVLLVTTHEVPAGGAIVAVDLDFTAQPLGYLVKFYVMPEHRGTTAGRRLIRACVDWFDARACVDCWATATAGIGEDGPFIALLGKVGFAPVGPTLRRQRHG